MLIVGVKCHSSYYWSIYQFILKFTQGFVGLSIRTRHCFLRNILPELKIATVKDIFYQTHGNTFALDNNNYDY